MALAPRLDLRQSQQLVLTPQLQQAIKLLQMPNLELQNYVQQEIERNPLLEPGGDEDDVAAEEGLGEDGAADGEGAEISGFDAEAGVYGADAGLAGEGMIGGGNAPLDAEFEGTVFDNAPSDAAGGGESLSFSALGQSERAAPESDGPDWEGRLSDSGDLRAYLTQQMTMLLSEQGDRLIAAHLIDLLDDAGYLTENTGEAAERLGCATGEVERILGQLQTLDPTGVFARDLGECLKLQLLERDRFDPAMAALVANLDALARQDFPGLRRACGVDDEDLTEMIRELRRLDPRPGYAVGGEEPQTAIPDVFVRRARSGGWSVELNSATLPRVLVDRQYYAELAAMAGGKKDKQYLSECLANANWLVRALDQRARTILTVASEIVRQQAAFFDKGVSGLKPLTLRSVAEAVEMHESTVSRVTSGKYMATNRGLFEFKYFFTSAVPAADGGEAVSSEAVRSRIKALVDAEDPKKVLSDDRIVDTLKQEGIDVARRTVAKYREAMGIPSSVERRRAKRARAVELCAEGNDSPGL